MINVFVWQPGTEGVTPSARSGYGIRTWQSGDLRIAMLSDLQADDMDRFARLWHAAATRAAEPLSR